jgi:hypothetical protein
MGERVSDAELKSEDVMGEIGVDWSIKLRCI